MIGWLLATLIGAAPAPAAADTVVVCPKPFVESLRPWLVYRAGQGHRIQLVAADQSLADIRRDIRRVAAGGALKHVLLVGDAEPTAELFEHVRQRCTPTYRVRAKVNIHWGSDPEIGTDAPFADLNDDGVPDVALGRLPVDSPDELSLVIDKILAYERNADCGVWQRRVNFVAGVGGFGAVADAVLEMATKKFLTDGIPAAYETSMTYGSWQSPFCPDPRRFHDVTLARLNEGCLFWVYIGHGHKRYLDRVRTPAGAFHIFDADDVAKLQARAGSPIAIFLACYTGAFDQPQDCLAEEMLRRRGGPTAIICGSRVTMPYAMAVMSHGMLDEYFQQRQPTIGEVLLHAKRRMAAEDSDDQNRQLLDGIAAAISPAKDLLREERYEHLALFHLIGDPLMRMHHPHAITLDVDATVAAGETLIVRGHSEVAGEGTIELVCRRDRNKHVPPHRDRFLLDDMFLRSFDDAYDRANDRVWLSQPIRFDGQPFEIKLEVPPAARGFCHIRALATGQSHIAVGDTKTFVRRPKSE